MTESTVASASDCASYPINGQVLLTHLGVIRVEGEDAVKFLHGQLTQDFSLLGMDQARLAALCSAQGRMLASFVGFKRSPSEVLLLVQRDMLAAMVKRLSMFVLRAKVKITDATDQFVLTGEVHEGSGDAAHPWKLTPETDEVHASLVELYPSMGNRRAIRVAAAEARPEGATGALTEAIWHWLDVRSGVVLIGEALTGALVPQMLNYESVGGVSFKKGCYPGQEVVARSQYRGTLKRRGFVVSSEGELAAGQEIFTAADPDQPCGVVAAAAENPAGGFDAVVSLQLASADQDLHGGSTTGPTLKLLPLPYVLRDDI